ncbi:multidrug effflux MFS transporter [Parvularcula sp. LCG005]|uniref:multidrug effflux MFS transporter n=1 Tax=Parvularcula sp. LCG005 TaxID=3078805 RepID=UPI00294296BE|nr:multidrug effflux MFS transporter [Parvularcula sp. LCG005]WOI52411.1 multidrug effflux MFS transporter [Parvularcula sp. LCG005]
MASYSKYALILGPLVMIGPVSIDMYLPALPTIASEFRVDQGAAQMTLTAYFIAVGLSQIIYGPLSDAFGRRPPMLGGLVLYVLASLGCAFAPSIEWLIAFRFMQGVGAASSMVIARAIVRDLLRGHEATRLMALMMLVISLAPMLAPLIGSFLIEPFGWRSVFFAVMTVAALDIFIVLFVLKETRPPELREPLSFKRMRTTYGRLLQDPGFMGLTMIGGFGMASFFSFLASASFIYIDHFGLTPTQFALGFAFNAVGFFGMSQMASNFGKRFGMHRVVRGATLAYASGMTLLFVLTLAGADNFYLLAGLLFVSYAFLGLVIPTATVLSLEENGAVAGSASALSGTLQTVSGAIAMTVGATIFDGTLLPMVLMIFICAFSAFVLSLVTVKPLGPTEAMA